MKKIFTLLFSVSCLYSGLKSQVLLMDDFDYSGNLSDNGWTITGTNVVDPIMTTTGLTYAGYPGSGIGNAAAVVGTNEDVNRGFTNQSGQGNVIWMSALVNVTDSAATTGGYFLHLGDRNDTANSTFTQFAARLFAKTNGDGNVNFGIANSASVNYGSTDFAINTTYLVVIKYTNDTSSATADDVRLWVLQSGVPTDQASLGTPEAINSATFGLNNIDAVGIRQTGGIPDVIIDGIRISNNYTDLVTLPLNLISFNASLVNGATNLTWKSTNEINVKDFTIEKSTDAVKYSAAGIVAARNRNDASYSFTDAAPYAGINYYRLRMTDVDGSYKISKVLVINNRSGISTRLFPNPVVENVTVSHAKATPGASIKIVNLQGQQLKVISVQQGATQTSFGVSELGKGSYILVYQNGTERTVTKFLK